MNSRSPFKFGPILSVMLLSCGTPAVQTVEVGPERYGADECWLDRKGNLSAFLVVSVRGKIGVPYVISSKCTLVEEGVSSGVSILLHLNQLTLIDSNRVLQRSFRTVQLSDDLHSEQGTPAGNSKVYYIDATVTRYRQNRHAFVVPTGLSELFDTKATFESFLRLPAKSRLGLIERKPK